MLTNPVHTALLEEEKFRIYSNRGEIRETSDGLQRIFLRGRMYPGAKVTRSFGDFISHHIGVTSEPQIKMVDLSSNDKFFIVGSGGFWEALSIEEVIDLISDMNIGERETYG